MFTVSLGRGMFSCAWFSLLSFSAVPCCAGCPVQPRRGEATRSRFVWGHSVIFHTRINCLLLNFLKYIPMKWHVIVITFFFIYWWFNDRKTWSQFNDLPLKCIEYFETKWVPSVKIGFNRLCDSRSHTYLCLAVRLSAKWKKIRKWTFCKFSEISDMMYQPVDWAWRSPSA